MGREATRVRNGTSGGLLELLSLEHDLVDLLSLGVAQADEFGEGTGAATAKRAIAVRVGGAVGGRFKVNRLDRRPLLRRQRRQVGRLARRGRPPTGRRRRASAPAAHESSQHVAHISSQSAENEENTPPPLFSNINKNKKQRDR